MSQELEYFAKKFNNSNVKILAVDDPAVGLYMRGNGITEVWEEKNSARVQIDAIPWSDYPGKLFSMLQEGRDDYDIIMAPGYFWLPKFASSGWLCTLDDMIQSNVKLWNVYDYDDIHPGLRFELEYLGKHFLFPCFSEIQLVFYRADLFKKEGVEFPKTPVSSEDYLKFARALHNPTGLFGTQIKASLAESFPEWLPWFSEFGGELFDGEKNPVFNSDAGTKAFEFMLALSRYCHPEMGSSDNEQILHLMHAGRIGIINHWSGQIGPILDKTVNPTAQAVRFSHLKNPWGSIWSFGINSASRNKEASFSYLCWATSKKGDVGQLQYSGSPVRTSTFLNPELRSSHPWLAALESAIQSRRSFPDFVGFINTLGPLYEMVNSVLVGKVAIGNALATTASKCRAALQQE